jgi:predicted lipoprotein
MRCDLDLPSIQYTRLLMRFCRLSQALAQRASLKPQEIATLLWASAKMAVRSTPDAALLAGLQERALETRAAGFGPQDLANTLWAFATLRLAADRKVLQALEERVLLSAHAFAPQHIANTLWALVAVAWECDVRFVRALPWTHSGVKAYTHSVAKVCTQQYTHTRTHTGSCVRSQRASRACHTT